MYGGIYRGIIAGASDPAQRGRMQVSVPALATIGWADMCLQLDARSSYRTGQQVWVMFEGGNLDYPVVMGVVNT